MKTTTDGFIPTYEEWKKQCKAGTRTRVVGATDVSVNERHTALVALKKMLYLDNPEIIAERRAKR